MRVAIVGSRYYPDLDAVMHYVHALPKDTELVTGGAGGVDREAEISAQEVGISYTIVWPEWDKLGKKAGPIRNTKIVEMVDKVVAFYDGKSRGTMDTINKARAAGKELVIVTCRRPPVGARKWDGSPQRQRIVWENRPIGPKPPPDLRPDIAWWDTPTPRTGRRKPRSAA